MIDYKNKNWLKKQYLDNKLFPYQIAELCNCDEKTIRNWLKKLDILIRPQSEAVHLTRVNHCNLSKEALEWISGELLGDGCLASRSPYSAEFHYGSKYLEYIQYISNTLDSFGIRRCGKICKIYHKERNYYSYNYASLAYEELLPIRKQWYPEGKKIVPKDIELTSLTCRQWYIGDGCLQYSQIGKAYIQLCTYGFSVSGVEWLVKQLIKLGFKTTRQSVKNIIGISTQSTKQFLDYIGFCPIKCYQYKWSY